MGDVEVLFDQVGEQVELGRADRGYRSISGDDETVPSGVDGDLAEPGAAELIRFQQAMQVCAPDRVARSALRGRGAVQLQPGRITAALDATVVNLVAVHGNSVTTPGAAPQHLPVGEFDLQIEQTQTRGRPRLRFD